MRPTILLADDCEMLGIALGELIARTANLLERVKDGGRLFERACVLRPDIIVSDISMAANAIASRPQYGRSSRAAQSNRRCGLTATAVADFARPAPLPTGA